MAFHLTTSAKEYIITPKGDSVNSIFITRGSPYRIDERARRYETLDESNLIFGIVGILNLIDSSYLIVITKERLVGTLENTRIYHLCETKILPLGSQNPSSSDRNYLGMISALLHDGNFFFYGKGGRYDLSVPFQLQYNSEFKSSPNPDFLWNWDMIPEEFQKRGSLNPFLQIIQGNVEHFQNSFSSGDFIDDEEKSEGFSGNLEFFLVSRRYKRMSGVRYHRRGVNLDGDCSNFVETDQIIKLGERLFGYLIIRGSVPLIWMQKVNMKYDPPIDTSKSYSVESFNSFQKHFEYLQLNYGKLGGEIFNVDLTKKKGSESKLQDCYRKTVKKYRDTIGNKSILYYSFDVNTICGHTKFSKLSILRDHLESKMEEHKYFSSLSKTQQSGVFRVNCKDSLDRTNLVQTYLTQFHTEEVLRELKLLKNTESLSTVSEWKGKRLDKIRLKFHKQWKFAWSDNGDKLSRLYSGTGALRTDVSRYGKQSIFGLFNDGKKSVMRYFLNNITDGYKQDCIDLMVGNYKTLSKQDSRSFDQLWNEKGILIAILMCIFFFFKPNVTPRKRVWFVGVVFIAFWLFLFTFVWIITFLQLGNRIVNRPSILRNEYTRIPKRKRKRDSD